MPKVAYSEAERERIKEALLETGLELFAAQGIQHTTVEQIYTRVGISRTFFYSFFPTKEDFVVQAFYRQRPKIVEHARRIMEDPNMDWRGGIRRFLQDGCYAAGNRFAVMTVEEQQAVYRHLSAEGCRALKEKQLAFFSDILGAFGIHAEEAAAKLLWNYVLSVAIIRKAIPNTLPFLFPEAADDMVELQIDALLGYVEKLRERQNEIQD